MGRRGPRPTPSALRRRDTRRDRINLAEPKPPSRSPAPSAPRSLSPEAKRIWRRLAPALHQAGVLTAFDVDALAVLCDLKVQHDRARQMLEPGLLVKGRGDQLVTNPAWRIYRDAAVLVRTYAAEFGLTPSARSMIRVSVPVPPALAG